jgi:hypothetical protein
LILHQEQHANKLYQKQQCNCVVPKSDDGYSADSIATSIVVPKSDDGFDTKEVRDPDLACPVLDIGMINVPNEYIPPYIDLLIDPLKKEENFCAIKICCNRVWNCRQRSSVGINNLIKFLWTNKIFQWDKSSGARVP